MKRKATVVAADAWLDGLMHESATFQAQVEERLAAINVAQDLAALRESRGVSQSQLAERLGVSQSAIAQLESAQPKNVELRTLVRVATALGAHVEVSIRPQPAARRRARSGARERARPRGALRSSA